jgi:hypothetical protein
VRFATNIEDRLRPNSQELFDHVNWSVGANFAGANGKQPVQE